MPVLKVSWVWCSSLPIIFSTDGKNICWRKGDLPPHFVFFPLYIRNIYIYIYIHSFLWIVMEPIGNIIYPLCIRDVREWYSLPLSQIPDSMIVTNNRPICPSNRLQLQKTKSTSFSAAIIMKCLCQSAIICARPFLETGSLPKQTIECAA